MFYFALHIFVQINEFLRHFFLKTQHSVPRAEPALLRNVRVGCRRMKLKKELRAVKEINEQGWKLQWIIVRKVS